jgi:hypothetical protein
LATDPHRYLPDLIEVIQFVVQARIEPWSRRLHPPGGQQPILGIQGVADSGGG